MVYGCSANLELGLSWSGWLPHNLASGTGWWLDWQPAASGPPHMGLCCLGVLTAWRLGSESEYSKPMAASDLALEISCHHFCFILLTKLATGASPNSRRQELGSIS